MAKRTKQNPDDAATIAALHKVAELMSSTGERLQQFMQASSAPGGASASAGGAVNSWDDPFSEAIVSADPKLAAPEQLPLGSNPFGALRTSISGSQPPAGLYDPGTPEFRYWVAAEALLRGIGFWGALLPPGTTWSTSNPMQVSLTEAAPQLNANYTRLFGLRFYNQTVLGFDIHASESPDVVCHELGHAVLDALRPQLFNVANTETSAFHESFGDISAMLCALQVPAMRKAVIAETGGRLNTNSRLSRLAEQLGWGLRQISPQMVDRDCLRNAMNHFFYKRPDLLPPSADADQLSSEEHSFSRVFTGAFLDALARMFSSSSSRDEAALAAISRDLGQLLIDAVHGAPVTSAYFSQVAAAMIQADQARFAGRNNAELTGAFLEHGILSVGSTFRIASAPLPTPVVPPPGAASTAGPAEGSVVYSYADRKSDDAHLLGFGQTPELPVRPLDVVQELSFHVHAPEPEPRFAVVSFAREIDGSVTDEAGMRDFVHGLIQRQQLDLGGETRSITGSGTKRASRTTHSLQREDGKTVLKRICFTCCGRAPARGFGRQIRDVAC